jgi:hypothetical protein
MRPRRRSFFVSSGELPSHILTIWMAQVDNGPFRLDVDTFHDALLACMVTVASTCAHAAKSLGAVRASKHGATTGAKRIQKTTWGGKTPAQDGCAARDLNPEPAD